MKKAKNNYRKGVALAVARLRGATKLDAAIAASQRLPAKLRSFSKSAIEVDQDALERIQEGQDKLRRAENKQ